MVSVSVVVPVYNAENYIERCVECLLNQTLKDLEVIFIDDGSTDNSGRLLDEWCNKAPDIFKVIHSDRDRGRTGRGKKSWYNRSYRTVYWIYGL